MKRTVSAILVAGVISAGGTLAAQSAATPTGEGKWDSKEMTISGCVEKTKSGGYFLMASADPRDPSPAGTSGTTSTTTAGAATTTAGAGTTTDEPRGHERGMTWNLGQSDRLERYVGQRVEVIGRAEHGTSGDQVKGTHGGGEIQARDFDVKSVKVLSQSCR
jgi:hypothetical protein